MWPFRQRGYPPGVRVFVGRRRYRRDWYPVTPRQTFAHGTGLNGMQQRMASLMIPRQQFLDIFNVPDVDRLFIDRHEFDDRIDSFRLALRLDESAILRQMQTTVLGYRGFLLPPSV